VFQSKKSKTWLQPVLIKVMTHMHIEDAFSHLVAAFEHSPEVYAAPIQMVYTPTGLT
jgi:hypothetical protein